MPKSKLLATALLHAAGVAVYIFLVATFMSNAEKILGKMDKVIGTMSFLLVFTLSAAVTGGLVLGRSLLWYLDGQKKEAVELFFYILGWLFIFILLAFGIQIII